MAAQSEGEHKKPESGKKEYEVVINGTAFDLDEEHVTFEQLATLAFPGHDPQAMFTVAYRNAIAAHGGNGMLVAGESVKVKKKGTSFDVRLTTRS
ncbi:multiubiquitin domain-containing protein [Rhodococcus pyridinivorans]|uniref:multiubiquitin domain-containing protein n=1 Tax=Rhodococcus pyridinivorans TaxID=103816 RepID=UPI0036A2B449